MGKFKRVNGKFQFSRQGKQSYLNITRKNNTKLIQLILFLLMLNRI